MTNTAVMNEALVIGRCTIGQTAGQEFRVRYGDLVRHALAVGATGSGKTVTLKRIAECMISDGIPVVAIDVLGDLSGLALPARRDYLAKIGLPPSTTALTDDQRREVGLMGAAYEERVFPRVLTPCSDIAERMALSPLPSRPQNFEDLILRDRDSLTLQADAGAAHFMARLGLTTKSARLGGGPDFVRGIITDALVAAWENSLDLAGLEGLQTFAAHLEAWGNPPLPEEAMNKVKNGVRGMCVGAEALWHRGEPLDFERLLSAPKGRVPLIVINIAHLPRDQHPWVVSQVITALSGWAAARGPATGRPRVGLLIDELAGEGGGNSLLPPGQFRSLSGECIRKVLRQGRHWDMSLLAGTQSPRDVDAKSFINFTNRFVGKLQSGKDIEIALEGAPMRDSARDYLIRNIGNARQGNMYALTASGGFESVQVNWLCTTHTKFVPEQFRALYEMGVIKRGESAPRLTTTADLPGALNRFLAEFKQRLDPKDRDLLQQMIQRYR
jgi:hypothetical protein